MDNMVDGKKQTPLRLPAPLSLDEHHEFIANHGLPEFHFSAKHTVAGLMNQKLTPAETALVKEYVSEGVLPLMVIQQVIYILCGNVSSVQFYNILLTARRLMSLNVDLGHTVTLSSIIRRFTDHERFADKRISTEEKLAAYTAVAAFAMNVQMVSLNMLKEPRQIGRNFYQYAVANEHLESLLRERPEQLNDIMDYIKERGMHRSNKRPVEGLRLYLDARKTAPAISEGWL
jgi:hypothetical protein